jgi:twitching motility protein PilT
MTWGIMNPIARRPLGALLEEQKIVTHSQLDEALKQQREIGGTLGEHLVRLGMVAEPLLLETLTRQTGVRHVNLAEREISTAVLRVLRADTVTSRRVLPVAFEGNHLVLGMLDPTDLSAITEAEFQSSKTVVPAVLSGQQFHAALEFFDQYGYGERPLKLAADGARRARKDNLASMLAALVAWKGQDLHLSDGAVPAVRVDGEMRRLDVPLLKGKDIAELVLPILSVEQQKKFAQQLELDFAWEAEGVGRFRCNVYRQRGSMAFTARHLSPVIPSMAQLRLPAFLRDAALKRQGLMLITGPNGHGKSTTMACLIDLINTERHANVISIEDPVEFIHHHRMSNVNQREVGADTLSFAEGLRHVYRQNPDVIVIGEMRDPESISVALTAAETGHLVMASMHALNSTSAVDRVIDVFPAEQQRQVRLQLADSLLMVFSQRLVKAAGGAGRVLAWERMSNSLRVANAIRDNGVHGLRALMQSNLPELSSLDSSLADLVAAKKVAIEEAQKWADDPGYVAELAALRSGPARSA